MKAETRIHWIWRAMKARCLNPNHKFYKYYGGRGITVCERWLTFENFRTDMGEPPAGYSIERKNNDAGYCQENCIWIPKSDQPKNRRGNISITIGGITDTMTAWCRRFGVISKEAAHHRISSGWPPEIAVSTPPNPQRRPWSPRS